MNSDISKIESALNELVGRSQIEELPERNLPLFLLADIEPDLVAFAEVNGRPEEDYSRALESFKSLYADKGDAWAERDLTLVLCIHDRSEKLSAYWNQIELDKYFCRKFVIDTDDDVNSQLKRLPFIPLDPQRVAGLMRPLPAETLLGKKHGIETWLAKALAVSGGQSPQTIIRHSLRAKEVPQFETHEVESLIGSPVVPRANVRIRELHIENFRAYCDQKFDFDADVIVLYGPNGLGKTSLFDAIDFLCTGGVTRFDERHPLDPKRLDALPHLGTAPSQSRISANLGVNGTGFHLARSLATPNDATIDNKPADRKPTLVRLANLPKKSMLDLRVDNLVRLFRATHLFGQDSASLTCEIHDKSNIPQDTVARMLAFQDYVEAISKSQKVADDLSTLIDKERTARSTTAEALKSKQTEVNSLSRVAASIDTPESIAAKARELANEIRSLLDIESETESEISASVIQGWRGFLDGELNNVRAMLTTARNAEARFPQLQEFRSLAVEVSKECETEKEQLARARAVLDGNQRQANETEAEHKALTERQRTLANRIESLNWLVANVTEHERLNREVGDLSNQVQQAQAQSTGVTASCDKMSADVTAIQNQIQNLQQQISSIERELSGLKDVLSTIDEWREAEKRLTELAEKISATSEASRRIDDDVKNVDAEQTKVSISVTRATDALNFAQRSQTQLQTLLDSLTQYVRNEVCPLCGHPHKSKEALLTEIDRQRGVNNEAVNSALRELESAKSQEKAFTQRLQQLRDANILLTAELNSLTDERDTLSLKVQQYADRALMFGIIEANPDRCEQRARARVETLSTNVTAHRVQLDGEMKSLEEKQGLLSEELKRSGRATQILIDVQAQHTTTRTLLGQLTKKANDLQVAFDQAATAPSEIEQARGDSAKIKADLEVTKESSQKARAEMNRLKTDIGHREKRIQELEDRLLRIRLSASEIEELFATLEMPLDASAENVGLLRMRLEERELALADLRQRIIDFEIVLDASQKQATLAKLNDELTVLQKADSESAARVQLLDRWKTYFDDIHHSLIRVQKTVLDEYVEKYGPLASRIQQRLRPVYGFGELKLHAGEEGSISVTVERNGKEYLPSDYFSESQLQIVMLSLFLSAVLTQTWSSFGLILLDDPVTHFDDLNAYALIDVIRGLVDTGGIKRQFVVSTCEERLYRLMRQRFGKIKTNAAFYEFQSIGNSGPIVVRR